MARGCTKPSRFVQPLVPFLRYSTVTVNGAIGEPVPGHSGTMLTSSGSGRSPCRAPRPSRVRVMPGVDLETVAGPYP